jgi:DNA-binding NarL/FixJ family response regulator
LRQLSTSFTEEGVVVSRLTPREIEILTYVAQGLTNKQIGEELAISNQTVKNHMTSIMHKLAAHDRTEAVLSARRRGWVTLAASEPPAPHSQESHLLNPGGQLSEGPSLSGA